MPGRLTVMIHHPDRALARTWQMALRDDYAFIAHVVTSPQALMRAVESLQFDAILVPSGDVGGMVVRHLARVSARGSFTYVGAFDNRTPSELALYNVFRGAMDARIRRAGGRHRSAGSGRRPRADEVRVDEG